MTRRLTLSSSEIAALFNKTRHEELAARLLSAAATLEGRTDVAKLARRMGAELGLYAYFVPEAHGGRPVDRPQSATYVDVRSLVLVREALGQISPLADSIFAAQGLGCLPIALAGNDAQRRRYLPDMMAGTRMGAFALTEADAGSDASGVCTTARRDGDGWVLEGEKTFVAGAAIASHFVVFASTDPNAGRKGLSAFVVERDTQKLAIEAESLAGGHPIGKLFLAKCVVPAESLLGAPGGGFALAMDVLDTVRAPIGAAAVGMATRALERSIEHVKARRQLGAPMADQPIVKIQLAQMATELDAARLLVARAAHKHDTTGESAPMEAAMAKMYATEAAQRIVDLAVQLHGGLGVVEGSEIERLYRAVRPLRIQDGTTELEKLVIAKGLLARSGAK